MKADKKKEKKKKKKKKTILQVNRALAELKDGPAYSRVLRTDPSCPRDAANDSQCFQSRTAWHMRTRGARQERAQKITFKKI
jgi:hypothetical protein